VEIQRYANVVLGDDSPELLERFAQRVAEHGNYSLAYREVFKPGPSTLPRTIWNSAAAYARTPNVAARLRELNIERSKNSLMAAQELVNDWVDIARCDPNEIVRYVHENCRHCRGVNFAYQWRDMQEWIDACAKNAEMIPPKAPPDFSGGFGFNSQLEPNGACPHCYGDGIGRTIIADTTKLTGAARKLFKGVRTDRFGATEVLLHDQEAARQSLGKAMRLLGNDPTPLNPTPNDANVIDGEVSAVTASTAYLAMVK